MADRHRHPAITFRPPQEDKQWLADYAKRTGHAVNSIILQAITEYRKRHDGDRQAHPPARSST